MKKSFEIDLNKKTALVRAGHIWRLTVTPEGKGIAVEAFCDGDEQGRSLPVKTDSIFFSEYSAAVAGEGLGHGVIDGFAADCVGAFAAEVFRQNWFSDPSRN